ncbi:replicative DNA helicase [Stagnimonas aquatica]|uniref:Replicative DNA helicase n=1 Tax=Stagnimonas aquatica TaxID=2689987 RepID=A0A3N0V4M5_9GAMM|nr:replicative DNA helicase [Stagnimonas aquatica]ROH87747.1 replicative DNA helicase [Stagnimonas aquatica]
MSEYEPDPRDYRGDKLRRLPTAARLPPHALEAEMSVLGGLMLDNRKLDEIMDLLREEDFYTEPHRLIYRAIRTLAGQGRPFDWVTVSEALRDDVEDDRKDNPQGLDSLERVGGQGAVAQLTLDVPGASNVRAYAEIVQERSIQRELIATGLDTVALGQSPDGRKAGELIDEAEQKVFAIRNRAAKSRTAYHTMAPLMEAIEKKLVYARDNPGGAAGLPTGFTRFDEMTNGLHKGDLVIVAGRPSMGKTSFAMNIAEYAALERGTPVAVFSMEMSAEQLALRVLSSFGRIDQQHLRTGEMDDMEWAKLASASGLIREAPLFIDETGALSPLELRSRARRIAAKNGLGLIVVDYIQLMQIPGSESRTNEISEISRSLKALAKELEVPVIALSQLNRGVENRDNKRPRMADLRESGGIEQDADVIVFIYRDEVYNKESPDKGQAEIIIGKQRNGPTGTCKTAFLGQFTRFDNLESLAPPGYEDYQ